MTEHAISKLCPSKYVQFMFLRQFLFSYFPTDRIMNIMWTIPIASQEVKRLFRQFDHFVIPIIGFSITEGFYFLHFPLSEFYVSSP